MNPLDVPATQAGTAPAVHGMVGVEIDFKNLPRGVSPKVRSRGQVRTTGRVTRGVALDYDDEDGE
jgi:hypothetical protein